MHLHHCSRYRVFDLNVARGESLQMLTHQLVNQAANDQRFGVGIVALSASQHEQVVDDAMQALGFAADVGDRRCPALGIKQVGAQAEHLRVAVDRRDRRLQFVRDESEEFVLRGIGLTQLFLVSFERRVQDLLLMERGFDSAAGPHFVRNLVGHGDHRIDLTLKVAHRCVDVRIVRVLDASAAVDANELVVGNVRGARPHDV